MRTKMMTNKEGNLLDRSRNVRRTITLNDCLDKIDVSLKEHYGEGFRYQIEDEGDGYSILINIYEERTNFGLKERELSEE
jgi:hypothetical protein